MHSKPDPHPSHGWAKASIRRRIWDLTQGLSVPGDLPLPRSERFRPGYLQDWVVCFDYIAVSCLIGPTCIGYCQVNLVRAVSSPSLVFVVLGVDTSTLSTSIAGCCSAVFVREWVCILTRAAHCQRNRTHPRDVQTCLPLPLRPSTLLRLR